MQANIDGEIVIGKTKPKETAKEEHTAAKQLNKIAY